MSKYNPNIYYDKTTSMITNIILVVAFLINLQTFIILSSKKMTLTLN